jgi:TolB-like protein
VKLVPSALPDDINPPSDNEGVSARSHRLVAQVRPLTKSPGISEPLTPPWLKHKKGLLGWIGGILIILALFPLAWAITHYRGTSKAPASIHALAVLPLEDLSGDKEQEYFADGMTDALITDLAQIGSLRVISRTSAMQFKGSKKTLPQIGHDLQVDAVVEGTVVRSAGRVRVTAQLVEAGSDHHLWAKSYERDLKDVLALQDEIAQDVAEQIRVNLTPKSAVGSSRFTPSIPERMTSISGAATGGTRARRTTSGKGSTTSSKPSLKIRTTRLPIPVSRTLSSGWHITAALHRKKPFPKRRKLPSGPWNSILHSPKPTRLWRSSSSLTIQIGQVPKRSSNKPLRSILTGPPHIICIHTTWWLWDGPMKQ